jgi:hypothetical protein
MLNKLYNEGWRLISVSDHITSSADISYHTYSTYGDIMYYFERDIQQSNQQDSLNINSK